MGGTSSSQIDTNGNNFLFHKKYNWIPAYPMKEYDYINKDNYSKYITGHVDLEKKYVDLRPDCPPILDINDIPVHPIASVCSIINYQLNKNKLPLFPPSRLFIYHNCCFFEGLNSIFSFEVI